MWRARTRFSVSSALRRMRFDEVLEQVPVVHERSRPEHPIRLCQRAALIGRLRTCTLRRTPGRSPSRRGTFPEGDGRTTGSGGPCTGLGAERTIEAELVPIR